uniref:RRM domain-containing protein n=1 Tax=viral metagenome TaxID=1070528 RepID=A0A6C0ITS9_9ZZZZ
METISELKDYEPSLCIPRIFGAMTDEHIRSIFQKVNLGIIRRIDIIHRKNERGEDYKRVFIHFTKWFTNNPDTNNARQRLLEGKDIKIVYDNPWFWKVSASKLEDKSRKNIHKRDNN